MLLRGRALRSAARLSAIGTTLPATANRSAEPISVTSRKRRVVRSQARKLMSCFGPEPGVCDGAHNRIEDP